MGFLTGLTSRATWAVHSTNTVLSGAPKVGVTGDSDIAIFPHRVSPLGGFGYVNFYDPLEGNVLYMMCDVRSNSDNVGFEIQLRRNGSSTVATIAYAPLETGRKALILNQPYLFQDFMQVRFVKPQNFSIVSFFYFFAGKL